MKEESNMKYFSEAYFRNIAYSTPLYEQRTYSDNLQGASLYKQFDIFLSYNISDLNVVKGIYYTLSKMGLQVYLDCIVDVDLKRNETNKDTAKRLQKRLMSSKSLIYAQSPEAGRSNWMPWELGVVDGHTGKCMIMPVTKDAQHASPQREIPSRLADLSERHNEEGFVKMNGLECVECGSCSFVCPAKRNLKQAIGSMRKIALANKRK